SIPIEYWAYWRYKPFQRHQKIRFRAAVVANLTSYSLIIFYIITISIGFPQPTKYSNPFGEIILATREIMQAQKAFYSANNKFTSNFAELPSLQLFIDKQNNSQAEGHYFNYTLMSDRATVEITFIPNENSRLPISYITLLRGEPFSYQICEFRDNTPLASPQIVENEIQCPPGSEKSGITINLE
ncbi:MAG: hypothetical protein SAJ12_24140, partial [Jaaginema sp. PMC 1079.18]|nr:hypothetical protein [Jaaginema sp. PMC 1079.18]